MQKSIIHSELENESILAVHNLIKKYKKIKVLDGISVNIKKGQRIGIVGPNGSGKTTFCETISLIRKANSGEIVVQNDLKIGMQLQESVYAKSIKGRDLINLLINHFLINISALELNNFLELLNITDLINSPINNLSGGQKQRVNILLAVLINPDLLILDELTTGLDLESQESVFKFLEKFLNNKDKTLLLISHNMKEIVRFCDEIWFMNKGKIISKNIKQDLIKEYGSLENWLTKKFSFYHEINNSKNENSDNNSNSNIKWQKKWDAKNGKRKSKNK